MSLTKILATIGKDAKDVENWIDTGLKLAIPIVGVVDPPLGAIVTRVESVLSALITQTSTPLTAASVEGVVTTVATNLAVTGAISAQTASAITLSATELVALLTSLINSGVIK